MRNREELAWAAGLFDGEGWIGAQVQSKRHHLRHLRVAISMNTPDVLHRFHAVIGLGNVIGPHSAGRKNPIWKWQVNTFEQSQAVVAFLWRWLSEPKRIQSSRAMNEMIENYRGRENRYFKKFCKHGHLMAETRIYSGGWRCGKCTKDRDYKRYWRARGLLGSAA